MPWVRGHYRRRRRRAEPDAGCVLVLLVVAGGAFVVSTVVTAFMTVVVAGVEFIARNWLPLSVVALLAAAVPAALALRSWRRTRATARFLEVAGALADRVAMSADEADRVARLRDAAGPLTHSAAVTLEHWYRETVAEAVADQRVTGQEREHLDSLRRAFGLADAVSDRAEVEAFLEVYAGLVADKRLTEAEDQRLAELRSALRIPDAVVADQIALASKLRDERLGLEAQLRKAKAVASEPLAPVETAVRLKAGEVCFYASPFTEKKERVSRSYVVGGVRHRETEMEEVRTGDLYLTDERLLLVASGTTTIKLAKIMDHAVDGDSQLLALIVDGRKTPHYLEVPEPFVVSAYIERVAREQPDGDA